ISPVGSGVAGATGSVNINFKQAIDYFGFYAGSLDNYNFIDIYNGSKLLKTFSGSDVPSAIANGSWTSKDANMFINLVGDAGDKFDKVVLRSNGIAFETDNHTYRVAAPEPNGMLGVLAIGSIGAASFLKRRQKKAISGIS
ncbi:PEP-CTERM sorting domain-containing protein, partial [Aetokthonos hydrillicola]